jgi:hypothetical protein
MLFNKIRQILKKTIVFKMVVLHRRLTSNYKNYEDEVSNNIYVYSPTHDLIKKIARENNLNIFIESGTLVGNTIVGIKNSFKRIYSIELDKKLHQLAKSRFKEDGHIAIIYGDSTTVMPKILHEIEEPALFWLDAHYSSGVTAMGEVQTPIMKELKSIFNHPLKSHIILIDDAKDFKGTNDYPDIDFLISWIKSTTDDKYYGYIDGPVVIVKPR